MSSYDLKNYGSLCAAQCHMYLNTDQNQIAEVSCTDVEYEMALPNFKHIFV